MAKDKQDKTPELTFEQAITELTGIVERIEQGQIPLDDSLAQYEKGMTLIRHCRTLLKDAEARIEVISRQQDAEPPQDERG